MSTWTDSTASIGRLNANCPVTGSVTFALLTVIELWLAREPFIAIWPSGPRITPGTSGSASSSCSFGNGRVCSVFCLTELSAAVSAVNTPWATVAIVTEAVTSASSRLMFCTKIAPARMVMILLLVLKPSEVASRVYSPGNNFVNSYSPASLAEVSVTCTPRFSFTLAPGMLYDWPSGPEVVTVPCILPVPL